MSDPGDESQPFKPQQVSTTLTFFEPPSPALKQVAQWWLDTAAQDFTAISSKIAEYGGIGTGSADLRVIGENIAELLEWRDVPDALLQELGCFFYLQGKIARLISDYKHKRPGKEDTLLDISVYTFMIRRLQATGSWP